MGDYISADFVPGHPLSGSGKQIPKGSNEGFTPQSGSDAFLIDQGFSIADTGAIRDSDSDKRISFTDTGFVLAYFLKSLSLKILFIVFIISRKPIFLLKNMFTRTSLHALTIVGVETPNLKH